MTEVNQQTKAEFGCDRSDEQQRRIAPPDFMSHIVSATCCFELKGDASFLSGLLQKFLVKVHNEYHNVFTIPGEKIIILNVGEIETYLVVCCCGTHKSVSFKRKQVVPYTQSNQARTLNGQINIEQRRR
eukprot:Lithocolla_globosa_v1_NODE_1564_length_2484_cov_11.775628.p2 type:complete len:129 gc:universal NODE_1564_length_2484_cov_11.775628:838-1224(+)